jgi:endonuclease-3
LKAEAAKVKKAKEAKKKTALNKISKELKKRSVEKS